MKKKQTIFLEAEFIAFFFFFFVVAFFMTIAYVTIDYGHTQKRPLRVTVPQLTIFVINNNNNQPFLSF